MLMRLRWKFTLVLMLILSGALGAALAVQTVSTLRQYRAGTDQALLGRMRRPRRPHHRRAVEAGSQGRPRAFPVWRPALDRAVAPASRGGRGQIGRASCRERV